MDKKVFVLLLLLKEMRTLDESEILSFFVYGVNQGVRRGGGESKTLCNLMD